MNIPNTLLTTLFGQPTEFAASESGQIAVSSKRFGIGDSNWSLLATHSGKGGGETWFIRPITMQPPLRDRSVGESELWTEDLERTQFLRMHLRTLCQKQRIKDPSSQFSIVQSETMIRLLIVNCGDFQLVADLLYLWGTPPPSVVVDWVRQLDSLRTASYAFNTFSTAETLIAKDGLLLPLSVVIEELSEVCKSDPNPIRSASIPPVETCSIPAPDWPSLPSIPDEDPLVHPFFESISLASPKPKSIHKTVAKRPRVRIFVCSLFGIALLLGAIVVVASRTGQFARIDDPSPQSRGEEIVATLPEPDHHSLTMETKEPSEPIDPLADSLDSSNIADSGELTVDSLLDQLQTKPLGLGNLEDVSAASIVDGLLAKTNTELPNTTLDRTAVDIAAQDIAAQKNDLPEMELETLPSGPGATALKQPMQIRAARSKEFVSIGKRINVKSCSCEIELRVPNKLVLEPSTKIAIEGPGKQAWKVAIEDEEPELVFEIESKPGSRWQIIHSVGLRERSGASPVLIGPQDSQVVINRFILYKQWLSNSAEFLRNERAIRQSRKAIDFNVEIKRLENLEREMEQAVKRWRVISQLTRQFFNEAQVLIQFNATEKG